MEGTWQSRERGLNMENDTYTESGPGKLITPPGRPNLLLLQPQDSENSDSIATMAAGDKWDLSQYFGPDGLQIQFDYQITLPFYFLQDFIS